MALELRIYAGYFVDRPIYSDEDIKQYLDNLATYLPHLDKLYIYNQTKSDIKKFISSINASQKIEYVDAYGYGEAEIYQELVNKSIQENADFVTYIRPGYFYEESVFSELKKYLATSDLSKLAILTPMPLLACEIHERKSEAYRTIKGCRLLGALLNLHIYKESPFIKTEYYQTTFDYEYCLRIRNLGYDVVLAQNCAFRNQNYRTISRKLLFITLKAYERDIMDLYYETRNRYYLWDEYKYIDPEYIKIDKKLAHQERKEIRTRDKNYRDKFIMIDKAKDDYKEKKLGKYNK